MHSGGGRFALFLLAVFILMAAISFEYPVGARTMPVALGMAGAALCLLQLISDYAGSRQGRVNRAFHPAPKLGRPEPHDRSLTGLGSQTLPREVATWAIFLTFLAGLIFFGFHIAVPALVLFYLRLEARISVVAAAAAAVAAWAAIHVVAAGFFGLALFPGLAGPYAMQAWFGD